MKRNHLFSYVIIVALFATACGTSENNDQNASTDNSVTENDFSGGQSTVQDDESQPNIVQVAASSEDHTTLVAAVQAAELENVLVNAGPLMVFAPTNEAFASLPEGTVENLLKPENKDALANILKYHVTPGNYSKDFLKKFKKLGQANNQYVKVEVVDGEPMIGGAKILASVKAGNGIVHVIDKVLLPPTEE